MHTVSANALGARMAMRLQTTKEWGGAKSRSRIVGWCVSDGAEMKRAGAGTERRGMRDEQERGSGFRV